MFLQLLAFWLSQSTTDGADTFDRIQSFLLGVPKIIVGFRTPDGFLKRIEEMDTASIPGTVKRRGKGTWDGNMCINFASGLLDCKWSIAELVYTFTD